jgi:hypothetical protein
MTVGPLSLTRKSFALTILCAAVAAIVMNCRSTPRHEPRNSVYWARLSEPTRQRLRTVLSNETLDDFDKIVKAKCKVDPIVQCVCCGPQSRPNCNANNWDCCASVVFIPADGAACAFEPAGRCNCPVPQPGH